jgi:hypothetical protein
MHKLQVDLWAAGWQDQVTLVGHKERRAARGCKRPKSREETPKEGDGNARRCRTATTWPRRREKARDADLFSHANMQCWASPAAIRFHMKLMNRERFEQKIKALEI